MKDGVNNKVITCSVNYEWPAHPERFFWVCFFFCKFRMFYHIKQLKGRPELNMKNGQFPPNTV